MTAQVVGVLPVEAPPPAEAARASNSTISGNLVATRAADLDTIGGSVAGSLSVNGSTAGGDGKFDLCGTDIGANLTIQNVSSSTDVAFGDDEEGAECPAGENSATVGQSLVISQNASDVDVEAPAGARNTFGGDLSVTRNTRDVDIKNSTFAGRGNVSSNATSEEGVLLEGNSFGGTLSCSGNEPDPTGSSNTAPAKTGECAGL